MYILVRTDKFRLAEGCFNSYNFNFHYTEGQKIVVCRNTVRSIVKAIYPNTRGTRCLPVRSETVGQPRRAQRPFFVFFSYTEHGGSIFLRNISKLIQEDAASSPSQYRSS